MKEQHDLRAIAHKAMIDRGLQPDFPPEALHQLDAIQGPAQAADHAIRDLRHLLWCSIDNDSSQDLDQLTVAEKLAGGRVKILVAVADVDALVEPSSPIDRHARNNTTSVYTAAQIFPMLPERLSTDLTSLGEGAERLALIIEMTAAADGSMGEADVFRGLVRNRAKLAYHSVANWLDGKDKMPDRIARVDGLDEQLRMQDHIAQVMKTARYRRGALDLLTVEPEAVMTDGKVVELRQAVPNRAQELIAEFMIAANGVVARFLEKQGLAALRRVVRTPQRWDRIRQVAREYKDELPAEPDAKALGAFLARQHFADPLRFPDLSLIIIKLLGNGEYVVQFPGHESAGHFGLAVRNYSHSTAPNRRFPDLITQRLLKCVIGGNKTPYSVGELEELATHCTERENAARKVERQVRKSVAALFLEDRVGETFDALVTGAADKGTWVRLLRPPVEGRLMHGGEGVDVGDQIRVRLVSLNVERGFIDFVRAGK